MTNNRLKHSPAASTRKTASTIVEISLAIAVVSCALLTVLSLVVLAEDTTVESIDETRAALLIQNAIETARFTTNTNPDSEAVISYYNNALQPLGPEFTRGAAYEIRLCERPSALPPDFPGSRLLNAEFRVPASAAAENQTVFHYSALIREIP